eukprot:c5655_g1_i1.p1 GENE.c5655_g1_i1~~c5655_g1_i1.p1  ORF type:complete len:255 (+),score=62.64 c5655_g1_i1:53-817(+)
MASTQGRLFVKKTDEGGADAIYDGAAVSDFQKVSNKPSSNFAQAKPRFADQTTAPDVDVHYGGIGDAAHGKGSSNFNAHKPRFEDPAAGVGAGDYNAPQSDFEKAISNSKPSPMMHTPEKQKDRSAGWMTNADQVNSPPPADLPGAFNVKSTPSHYAHSSTDRFKGQYDVPSHGEPGAGGAFTSDFAKAASNTKPSPAAMAASQRFKNDVVSYGDPGAAASQADIERQQLQAKIAHQKQQADLVAQRDLSKYEQ